MILEELDRVLRVHRLPIRALRCQRVEGVRRGEYAAADGDVRPRQPAGIARPVPMLVVIVYELQCPPDMLERRQNLHADPYMLLHVLELFGRQLPRLVEHRLTSTDLSHVVEAA